MHRFALALVLTLCFSAGSRGADHGDEILYGTEGNRLRRYAVDSIGTPRLVEEIFIERASADESGGASGGPGRDVNGMICFVPDGSGNFVLGEDTGQPDPTAGWGVFDAQGLQVGKLTPTYFGATPEPFGCAFDPATGALYTTSVGDPGFGANNGQLIKWFPPFDRFPGPPGTYPEGNPVSTNFCKIAVDIGTAGGVAVDGQGRIWVASTSGLNVTRYTLPAGKSLAPGVPGEGCTDTDALGSPLADASVTGAPGFEARLIGPNAGNEMFTFSGLAIAPNGNLYAASVLTGRIAEYALDGSFVRYILDHDEPGFGPGYSLPQPFGTPQGIAVGGDGSVYYADLDLGGSLPDVGPGPDGKVWRIRFEDPGDGSDPVPLAPEIVRADLAFPDGVVTTPGSLRQTEWPTLSGSAARLNVNPEEQVLGPDEAGALVRRWGVTANGAVTASPVMAAIDLPGFGLTQVVFIQSWDLEIYAIRLDDGSVLWRFPTEDQPGASFPAAASVHVAKVDNRDRVFVGQGEIFYSIDAVTGEEVWRFAAGTGCRDENGDPPGLCGFSGERNQIESSAYVAGGKVFFGMDVNDVPTGKGGFFALDAADGRMRWFFDLESGATCRPDPDDEIRGYDGYHSEEELGLPAGFFASREGCDHPRTPNGCGNVWSSAALDLEREALFVASSNCDTPIDPATGQPETMPPFDEAIFSLDYHGNVRWVWRPRRFDNEDLAFGAVPQLFDIALPGGGRADVVGVGGKDGTYYVLDRDGRNQANGAVWNEDELGNPTTESHVPANLPYWRNQVVAGGDVGGIIATAAADPENRRIHFSTAIGVGGEPPQQPTVHSLDMDTGAVLWQANSQASFGPTGAANGVVYTGFTTAARLRQWRADDGTSLGFVAVQPGNVAVASGPVVVDGTLLVGAGIGTRSAGGSDPGDIVANIPAFISAFCAPGTTGCAACNDGIDNDLDGAIDAAEDDGCVDDQDHSEVLGDLNYDNEIDDRDQPRMQAAFGTEPGQPGYVKAGDLYPPEGPDGIIGLQDWQQWLLAEEAAREAEKACGLLGIEPLLAVGALRWARRRRRSAGRGA